MVALASPAPFSIPSSRQNNYYNYNYNNNNNNNNKMMTTTTPERSPVPLQSHLHVSFAYGAAGWVVGGASDTQPSDAPGCSGMLRDAHRVASDPMAWECRPSVAIKIDLSDATLPISNDQILPICCEIADISDMSIPSS